MKTMGIVKIKKTNRPLTDKELMAVRIAMTPVEMFYIDRTDFPGFPAALVEEFEKHMDEGDLGLFIAP